MSAGVAQIRYRLSNLPRGWRRILDRRPRQRNLVVVVALLLVFLIASVDYFTGIELSFSVFYLLPVILVSWTSGIRGGVALSLFSALVWLLVDGLQHSYTNPVIPYWNAAVRLVFFLVTSYLISERRLVADALQESRDSLSTIVDQRTAELRKANAQLETELQERKTAEQALLESESRFSSLYSSMREGVALHELIHDEEGNPTDYRIIDVNPAYEAILGLSKTTAVGAKATELYRTDELPYLDIYAKVATTGIPERFETTFEPMKKTFRVSVFSPGENRFATVFDDVTESKVLQEQLYRAQKMEAVGRLAGGIAHDFNNLLTVIMGCSELILSGVTRDDAQRGDLEQIRKAAQQAASLTSQLLAFSRKQILSPRVLDLNTVIADLEKMLRRLIRENIEIVMRLLPGLGKIRADQGQLEQIIMNLAVNARDAMPEGGKLIIETANVDCDAAYARQHIPVEPGQYTLLSISDTGQGMTPEVQSHLFEPFFTTKEFGKGTGLGLSTVYGIVKQSGGYIWVYSEAGRGTTFKIYLPRVYEAIEPTAQGQMQTGVLSGAETILLVEDDQLLLDLTQRVLSDQGYTVLAAREAAEAAVISERHQGVVHLLLTDVVIPGEGGRLLAQRLSEMRPEMKVLYTSGYADHAVVQNGALAAGIHFLQKPFTANALLRKVRDVLETP